MLPENVLLGLCLAIPAAPAAVLVAMVPAFLARESPRERTVAGLVLAALSLQSASALVLSVAWLVSSAQVLQVDAGRWFGMEAGTFELLFAVDRLSALLLPLVTSVTLVVARFSVPYLHREPGFARFFAQLALFAAGIGVVVLAGSADVLVLGWECVGLASAMLVAFFHDRAGPARAATRVFITYRLCDVGLLVGTMMLHVFAGGSGFHRVFEVDGWPGGAASVPSPVAAMIAAAFVVAAVGKSAQLPVGGWLPRAMEGPTPSSALFYGGPAVHAGVFLLLRLAPLLEEAPAVRVALVLLGTATAVHSSILARVQNDQKCAIGYATMTQLGLMFVECGLGLWVLAQWHLALHVCLRTWQLLRAPSALQDALLLRQTNRGEPLAVAEFAPAVLPELLRRRAYVLGLERTHVETAIERWLLFPLLALATRADRFERRAVAALAAAVGGDDAAEEGPASPAMAEGAPR